MEIAGTEILRDSLLGSRQQHRPCMVWLAAAHLMLGHLTMLPLSLEISTFQLHGLEQAFADLKLLLSSGCFSSSC